MSIAVVANVGTAGTVNGATSGAIDTTGASLLVVGVPFYNSPEITIAAGDISDSKGNTYTALTQYQNTTAGTGFRLFYCANPTVGSSHTFTISKTGSKPSILVLALSGTHSTPFDVENGANSGSSGSSSLQPGSITPGQNNEIVITGCYHLLGSSPSVDSGMTISNNVNFSSGVNVGGTMAYKIQTTAAAINPTWSTGSALIYVAAQASFKVAAAAYSIGAGTGAFSLTGVAAGARATRVATAATGAFSFTGVAASLRSARRISIGAGDFALSGNNVGIRAARTIMAGAGAYALTGQAAGLIAARIIGKPLGSFVLGETRSELRVSRAITATTGAYALTGQAAGLNRGRSIIAGAGVFTCDGNTAGVVAAREITATTGAYALTGQAAAITYYSISVFSGDAEDRERWTWPRVRSRTYWPRTVTIERWAEPRVIARIDWPRSAKRDRASWVRVARWKLMSNSFPVKTITFVTGEIRRVGFDFSASPEVVAGETLSSPSIPAVSGITIGSPTVTSSAFDGIASGKAVTALITAPTAGSYLLTCSTATSGGATLKIPVRIVVADPEED